MMMEQKNGIKTIKGTETMERNIDTNAGSKNISSIELLIRDRGTLNWLKDGRLHRENEPAIIWENGSEFWRNDGEPHREDGPAIIHADGSELWYKNGKPHRTDGPAIICTDGEEWQKW